MVSALPQQLSEEQLDALYYPLLISASEAVNIQPKITADLKSLFMILFSHAFSKATEYEWDEILQALGVFDPTFSFIDMEHILTSKLEDINFTKRVGSIFERNSPKAADLPVMPLGLLLNYLSSIPEDHFRGMLF